MATKKQFYNKFSILDALRFGFYTIIEHFAFYLALMIAYVCILTASVIITLFIVCLPFYKRIIELARILDGAGLTFYEMAKNVIKQMGIPFIVALIIGGIVIYLILRLLNLGLTKIALEFYDYDHSSLQSLLKPWRLLLRDSIASFLYWGMCSIGYALFVIPGIYLMVTYGFYHQLIVDENLGIMDAFKASARITHGAKIQLFALFLLLGFIRWVGLSIFGITLLIVMPLISLVDVHVYRKLLEHTKK